MAIPNRSRLAAFGHHANEQYLARIDGLGPSTATATHQAPSNGHTHSGAAAPAHHSKPRNPVPAAVGTLDWRRGPSDPQGTLHRLSERPVLCGAADNSRGEIVLGGSDHALYVLDVSQPRARTLLGRRGAGHSEWVTSVSFLSDGSGRIVSAGMDGKLIVWDLGSRTAAGSKEPQTTVLEGHFGSISAVCSPSLVTGLSPHSPTAAPLILSSGYDKTVRVWTVAGTGPRCSASPVEVLKGHTAPVLCLDAAVASNGRMVAASGDRDGVVRTWDVCGGSSSSVAAGATAVRTGHRGHITALAFLECGTSGAPSSDGGAGNIPLLFSGAQDGTVKVWDSRSPLCCASVGVHAGDTGSGAVGNLVSVAGLVGTAGADHTVCALEPRTGFSVLHRFKEQKDFIYSLTSSGSLLFSGAGDGMLLCHDVGTGRTLWGLGANQAAVRVLLHLGGHLAASGDDGCAIVYAAAPS